jgi:hypothetical protein
MNQASTCVYEPRYLYWSYDDDMAPGWCAPVPPGGDVPVTASSPAGMVYGTTAMADELIGATVVPAVPSAVVTGPFGVASELMVALRLLANPDLGEHEDDDVDSLDAYTMQPTGQGCPYWYFSADHEARWGPPGAAPLDPGDIYLGNHPLVPGPVLAVDNTQLGVPNGTDVDAFEFVVLPMPDYPVLALAVLFSVDEDDPQTPLVNESGLLNPNAVYVSFLSPMAVPPPEFLVLEDDVDALTVYPQEPVKAPNLIPNVVGNIYPPEPWPDSTLPKEINNVIYLVFDEPIAIGAAPPVTIQQLLQSCPELLGPDLALNFTYTVLTSNLPNDTIKCKENGAVLANQTWYRLKPTASLTSVGGVPCNPFVLDLVTLQGDANNSCRVTTADYTTVKAHMGERNDNRYDLNGSERITTADYIVVKNNMGRRCPPKP